MIKENETYEFESQMFALHEMRDELEKAISNLQIVLSQNKELKQIVDETTVETVNNFEQFSKGLDESNKNYTEQLQKMTNKLNHISALLKLHQTTETEEDEKISKLVDMVVSYVIIALT